MAHAGESHSPAEFANVCTAQAMSEVATQLGLGVTVKTVPNGPQLPGGVRFTPATGTMPAFCQVTGSYVTNPSVGKTANFIATFPADWNSKYLQMGCSGSCGYLLMNDPAMPMVTISAQGHPGQLIEKGYAVFGNDLGHVQSTPGIVWDWALKPDGHYDRESLEDYLYRADLVMADLGKTFTKAVYGKAKGKTQDLVHAYFIGCSQGGRAALIAATRFPEKFDGIIAGSPASDVTGIMFQSAARILAAQQPGLTPLSAAQSAFVSNAILASCDGLDGVKDGLIQNPAACTFKVARDIPICKPGASGDSCLTLAQADNLRVTLSALTDAKGRVVEPGMPVSDLTPDMTPVPLKMGPADMALKIFTEQPKEAPLAISLTGTTQGAITGLHAMADSEALKLFRDIHRKGDVLPEDFDRYFAARTKLLWYHNLSDHTLTPFMSINKYRSVVQRHGGYAKTAGRIRFFSVPGTDHCGMGGVGPSSFDPMTAMENWVEHDAPPVQLTAARLDPLYNNPIMGKYDPTKPPLRTMPLCMYPRMASYKGAGDVNNAANWECRADDKRMEQRGAAGLQAGLLD